MKTLTFTYTKADGSSSERTLLATTFPGNKYAGIDISVLEPIEAAEFVRLANEIHSKYIYEMVELQRRFDLTYNYRQFLEQGVSHLSEIN